MNGGRNYNGPKVIKRSLSKIWLYAGNSEYLTLLFLVKESDNAISADNQQERLGLQSRRILRDYTPDTCPGEEIVRTSRRREEAGRNDRLTRNGGNRLERNSLSGKFRPARTA